jgi:hypothetical protein
MRKIKIPTVSIEILDYSLDTYLTSIIKMREGLAYYRENELALAILKSHIDEIVKQFGDDCDAMISDLLYYDDLMMSYYYNEQGPVIHPSLFVDNRCTIVINDFVHAYIIRETKWQDYETSYDPYTYTYKLKITYENGTAFPLRRGTTDGKRHNMDKLSDARLNHYLKKIYITTKYEKIGKLKEKHHEKD